VSVAGREAVPPDTAVSVEPMSNADWTAAARIFEEGIATGQATFETEVPGWEAWDRSHLAAPRLVARRPEGIVGWAALSPVGARPAYAGVAEVSVYVSEHARGAGVGRALLAALIELSEAAGLWTLQAVLFPENEASVRLHERCGFRLVGHRERIGRLAGRWRDTLLLERRSPLVT
jgi:L-amino acid N-acyltransferase YncA